MKACPFCGAVLDPRPPYCEHFVGWTDNGRTIDPREPNRIGKAVAITETDIVINTGVSARVYRKAVTQ